VSLRFREEGGSDLEDEMSMRGRRRRAQI